MVMVLGCWGVRGDESACPLNQQMWTSAYSREGAHMQGPFCLLLVGVDSTGLCVDGRHVAGRVSAAGMGFRQAGGVVEWLKVARLAAAYQFSSGLAQRCPVCRIRNAVRWGAGWSWAIRNAFRVSPLSPFKQCRRNVSAVTDVTASGQVVVMKAETEQ